VILPSDWPSRVEQASPAELPGMIGQLSQAQAAMWARLHRPVPLAAEPQPGTQNEARMVGIGEAATYLRMSTSWMYRNAASIPLATKIGSRWRFSTRGLDKYLRDHQTN